MTWIADMDGNTNDRQPHRIHEAARRLNVSDQQVRRAIKDGRLDAFRMGKIWLVRPESVDRLLRGEAA